MVDWFSRRSGSRVSIHNPVRLRVLRAPSLSINPMPPRTTRKSDRRNVSDRTMVGTAQPLCLSASETEGRRYYITMNLGKGEITAPHGSTGLDDDMPSSRWRSVFLDIPFYRTGFSETGIRATVFGETNSSGFTAIVEFRFRSPGEIVKNPSLQVGR